MSRRTGNRSQYRRSQHRSSMSQPLRSCAIVAPLPRCAMAMHVRPLISRTASSQQVALAVVVLDAFSRRGVGWSMETHLRTELVLAGEMAIGQCKPFNVVHHSGQGSHYPALAFRLVSDVTRMASARPRDLLTTHLRQRHARELLRHTRMRTAGTPAVCFAGRSQDDGLQLHRRLVQPCTLPFQYRLSVIHCLRGEHGRGAPSINPSSVLPGRWSCRLARGRAAPP